jgi:hypothetical protein
VHDELYPNLSSVSEDDPRALSNKFYTPPGELPPLDIHFPGQNGAAPLSDTHGSPLTSTASCRDCMVSQPQENLAEVGHVEMNMPSAASSTEPMALEHHDNSAEEGDAIINMPRKEKKRRRASSGVVHGESLIFMALSH